MASSLHEEYSREHAVEVTSNRRFGLMVGGIAFAIGAVRSYLHGGLGWFGGALMAIGLFLVIAGLAKPDVLEPAKRGWMKLGLLLHKVTNPLFLGGIYAVAVIPTGLAMRIFGVDPMGTRRPRGGSYWIARQKTGSTAQSLQNPF